MPERLNHGVELGTDGGVGNPQFLFHFLYIAPAADKRFCEIQLFVGEVIEFAEPEVIFNDCVAGIALEPGHGQLMITPVSYTHLGAGFVCRLRPRSAPRP